jgi:hypothetical protein
MWSTDAQPSTAIITSSVSVKTKVPLPLVIFRPLASSSAAVYVNRSSSLTRMDAEAVPVPSASNTTEASSVATARI